MFIEQMTEDDFKECVKRGLTSYIKIGQVNSKNTKSQFSRTIPKPIRESDANAVLIIKNPKGTYKYLGMMVNEKAGALKILKQPDILWHGYLYHGNSWYHVNVSDLIAGRVKHSQRIIPPEMET